MNNKNIFYPNKLRRLVNGKEAAEYLGLSPPTFKNLCAIKPINLGTGRKILRYDLLDIDEWIERQKGGLNDNRPTNWLDKVGE